MRTKRHFPLSTVFLAVVASSLLATGAWGADVRDGSFELGAFGGYYIYEGNQWLSDAPSFGGRLGYFISRDLSFEFSTSYSGTDYNVDPAKYGPLFSQLTGQYIDVTHFRFEFLYHFPSVADSLVPFVGAGAGMLLMKSPVIDNELDSEVTVGLGMKYFITDDLLLRMDARYVCMLDNWIRLTFDDAGNVLHSSGRRWNNLETVFGASYLLGGKVKDSDGDGVPDDKDACPDTPKGAVVDAKGCPIDSDGDYVYDGIDQCPGTPAGAWVDSKGCPRDSDGDGVLDGIDQCPDTPLGTPVDAVGCPLKKKILDSDGDGVPDDIDKCPNTPPGVMVEPNGCSVGAKAIFFKYNSAALDTSSQESLGGVVAMFKNAAAKSPTAKVQIQGHTDSKGSAAYNQKLSLKRAEAVKDYLVSKGVPASMLSTAGFGASKPVATNATEEGRAMNRRIDFVIVSQ